MAVVKSHDLDEVSIPRSTIRRVTTRGVVCREGQATSKTHEHFLLHWDGKLLPDISLGLRKVDRVAVLVTDNREEKLLGVPMVIAGTVASQAQACMTLVNDWYLMGNIHGLIFHTTASNTGLHAGTCTLTERQMSIDLVRSL